MPSHYAHYRFGTALLAAMPADVRRSIQRFRRLYDVGLHGPDLFYYYQPLQRSGSSALAIKYHEQSGKTFFSRICRTIRMERSEAASAYLYGVLSHYVLDSLLHERIREITDLTGISHAELEAEFDRYLLTLDQKMPPNAGKLTAHLTLTDGECDTVARFYPPATAQNIKGALRASVRATKLLLVTDGPGRKITETALGLLGNQAKHLLMQPGGNPRCVHLNDQLLDAYDQAMALFPEYLQQIQALMTYSAPLESEFDKPFA